VLKGLRLRLTATYIAAALGLVLLMGLGTYGFLLFYFQSDNDAALRYRVAFEYARLGIELPPDLEAAKEDWQASHSQMTGSALPPGLARDPVETDTDDTSDSDSEGETGPPWKIYPDSELAPQFVLYLDASGKLTADSSTAEGESPSPIVEGYTAAFAAPDIRTVSLADGREVRVATYRLPASAVSSDQPVAYIQAGRLLADQNRVLSQILWTVLLVCGGAALAVGLASWYLAGRALRPAQKAWTQQRVFVANASHELRAPVTLIRASAEYALRECSSTAVGTDRPDAGDPEAPRVAEVLGDVIAETDHLSRLIDDLVLLSRFDAGKLELDIKSFPVGELLFETARNFTRLAEQGSVALETSSERAFVRADYTRLRQIVLILLDNALRHTPPGGKIALSACAECQKVTIRVADTGSGIAPEDLPHVFDRFYQGRSASGERRGSGLGLPIARTMAEALKGRLEIASQLGEGTTAVLHLPRADS
jgi:signal transduction histidine kinase